MENYLNQEGETQSISYLETNLDEQYSEAELINRTNNLVHEAGHSWRLYQKLRIGLLEDADKIKSYVHVLSVWVLILSGSMVIAHSWLGISRQVSSAIANFLSGYYILLRFSSPFALSVIVTLSIPIWIGHYFEGILTCHFGRAPLINFFLPMIIFLIFLIPIFYNLEKLCNSNVLSMDQSELATEFTESKFPSYWAVVQKVVEEVVQAMQLSELKAHSFWAFVQEALQYRNWIIPLFDALVTLLEFIALGESTNENYEIVVSIILVIIVRISWVHFKDLDEERRKFIIRVTRNGCRQKMSIYDLLLGDIVHLSIGDVVPADGLFFSGFPLLIDESSLTGAREPININSNNPFLLAGTKVQDGSCEMLVTTVRRYTWRGKLMLMATHAEGREDENPFQKILKMTLQRNKEEIGELKEILQRERQEKEQLTRENEHEKLQSEQVKKNQEKNLQQNEEEIGELKETLQRERQEKNQLIRKIEENEHDHKIQSKQVKVENDLLRSQRDEYINQIQLENERRLALEKQVSGFELTIKDLRVKFASDRDHIVSLQADLKNMEQKRDNLVRLVKEICTETLKMHISSSTALKEFSLQELQQATENFSESLKIGQGGFGPVYKGSLRQITVAIKVLCLQSRQGISQFQQEITVLTKMRHPNLITLIGTCSCSELSALVYEYLPNGSLEDRLTCVNNTPPLTWLARIRIIGEICLALIFLHSNKPQLVIHGDLKPENILLDTNLVSKLSDFGLSRLLIQPDTDTTAFFEASRAVGTIFYIDPEFVQTAILTPKSDIYSFGIIILRLLTGKPPKYIAREVQDAMRDGILLSVIDESAGTWPFDQAKELAEIALRCAKVTGSERPNLVNEVWAVVEPFMKAAICVETQSGGSELGEESIASHFISPTIQEVMQDPCIAADRFIQEVMRSHLQVMEIN